MSREMVLNASEDFSSTAAAAPLEKLRLQCLQRGVAGIKDFGRQVNFIAVHLHVSSYTKSALNFDTVLHDSFTDGII